MKNVINAIIINKAIQKTLPIYVFIYILLKIIILLIEKFLPPEFFYFT